jgi:hypothetical protein
MFVKNLKKIILNAIVVIDIYVENVKKEMRYVMNVWVSAKIVKRKGIIGCNVQIVIKKYAVIVVDLYVTIAELDVTIVEKIYIMRIVKSVKYVHVASVMTIDILMIVLVGN